MGNRLRYEPTSKDIARETAKIRAGWSEREHRKRAVGVPICNDWLPPVIVLEDVVMHDAIKEHNLATHNGVRL